MDGAIIVDKPAGWTSHDVVGKMRRIAGTRRVGHLGTLDPMATGVLPVVINRATRLSQFLMKTDKVYEAVVRFGYSTDTFDADGETVGPVVEPVIDPMVFGEFIGELDQIPPPVSAKKINGVPAYKLARRDVAVDLPPSRVTVFSIDLWDVTAVSVRIQVHCSSGTYIRRIANDAGQKLGCGAHLASLRRLRAGSFDIAKAYTLDALAALSAENRLAEALLPSADLLPEFPAEIVDDTVAAMIRHGRDFRTSPFRVKSGARYVRAIGQGGELIAIGEMKLPNLYHPMLVL
ncbi:MAG: tRNA pseudouridine(55) synthase TruB [Acidobacteria bacterium]|nr:tRNA pseudouridine(55) synthase TruB [Acidobacteriota bacterium]